VAIKNREYLAAVKPDGLFLILELMHFAQEVLQPESLKPAAQEVAPRELEMAKALIGAMETEWEPKSSRINIRTRSER
jgi:DNA end-binding protein Ku